MLINTVQNSTAQEVYQLSRNVKIQDQFWLQYVIFGILFNAKNVIVDYWGDYVGHTNTNKKTHNKQTFTSPVWDKN